MVDDQTRTMPGPRFRRPRKTFDITQEVPLVPARATPGPRERAEGTVLWIKGATFQQIAAAGFGIATASGAWRAVHRALAQIPKQEADQAREAQLVRLQALRMLLWNQASADPIRAAEALIKLEAGEARLLGLDMPTKVALTDPDGGIPLEAVRRVMERYDRATS
jgi:hypothetical protein